ncbi:low affinity potassium transporter [Serendipita sp. 401]|nr:low affinity potassium transporter [Serendipita sp. 401]
MPADLPGETTTENGHPTGVDIENNEPQKRIGRRRRVTKWLWRNLNFYRVHLLAFVLTPLAISVIFYLSNGQYHISYVDSLFLCVTSMTVTGLATVNLSTLTGFQQAIMYILMWIGHPITVSLIIIQSRMWMFEEHLEPLVRKRREELEARKQRQEKEKNWPMRVFSTFRSGKAGTRLDNGETKVETIEADGDSVSVRRGRLKVSMIRRMNNAPQRINPSGLVMETRTNEARPSEPPNAVDSSPPVLSESPKSLPTELSTSPGPVIEIRQPTGDATHWTPIETTSMYRPPSISLANRRITREPRQNSILAEDRVGSTTMPRSHTIEFSLARPGRVNTMEKEAGVDSTNFHGSVAPEKRERRMSIANDPNLRRNLTRESMERTNSRQFPRSVSVASHKRRGSLHTGFGGFPTPYRILIKTVSWVAPRMAERIRKRLTVPRAQSISLKKTKSIAAETIDAALHKEHKMIEEDLEFLGGVEYKSLKLLRLIVICYHIGIQIPGFALIAADATRRKWLPVFENQPRFIPPTWFSLFQATSAYTNTGTSLTDLSMVPFQRANLMIITMFILVLAGNTAFPIFLRLLIWTLHKLYPEDHPIQASLHFLLHHPRRCYIYLFPSHQTWFLSTMIVTLTMTDWLCFLILDIGNPVTEAVPIGHRVLIGLLQASAVRAAGFATISISSLAPAVKVLYVIMMYVSIYPIAMSVRSTNVYEERSLGIFHEDSGNNSESSSLLSQEQKFGQREGESRRKVWGEYLIWHANGAFSTLSKLVVIAVMIRGRHRGLPIAIDRAIVLPNEYSKKKEQIFPDIISRFQLESEDKRSRERDIRNSVTTHEHPNQEMEGYQRQLNALEAVPESGQPTPAMRPTQGSRSISPSSLSFLSSRDMHEQAMAKGKSPEL